MYSFNDFSLSKALKDVLASLGFINPTDIQKKAIPVLLEEKGVDFHGQAQTGTGKTLAFGIPLIDRILVDKKMPQALIIAPTRELALQICDSLRPLAQALNVKVEVLYGGVSMEDQSAALRKGCHIVVGTPGRLNDHIRRKTLSLKEIKTLILDEADIMLDMGFRDEVETIIKRMPVSRNIWLFSATVKSGIRALMDQHMKDPISVRINKKEAVTGTTKQYYCVVPSRMRMQALCRFIENAPDFYGFIFCQTKMLTSDVAEQLIRRGYNVGALHGDMSQVQRNNVIKKFKAGKISIVVATDVAARGIDVANLTHVINYSVPEDHESYIHRIGRTGRAGKEGVAITLALKSELRLLTYIQRKFSVAVEPIDVPSRESIVKARIEEVERYIARLSDKDSKVEKGLHGLVAHLSDEELRLLIAHILQDKFLDAIEEDIHFTPSQKAVDELKEICINAGSDDGITREQVVACITKKGQVAHDQIQKVRVIRRRTFIQLTAEFVTPVLKALRGSSLGGRKIRASISQDRHRPNSRSR